MARVNFSISKADLAVPAGTFFPVIGISSGLPRLAFTGLSIGAYGELGSEEPPRYYICTTGTSEGANEGIPGKKFDDSIPGPIQAVGRWDYTFAPIDYRYRQFSLHPQTSLHESYERNREIVVKGVGNTLILFGDFPQARTLAVTMEFEE